jgi:hypothetical protein
MGHMRSGAQSAASDEEALQAFLRTLPAEVAPRLRALAHAWTAAGGQLQVGRMTIRLVATAANEQAFTAGTLHASHNAHDGAPTLELCRVLLANHGLSPEDWTAWSDEMAELQAYGFVASSKFPTVNLAALPETSTLRLSQGLRDLGRLAHGQPT